MKVDESNNAVSAATKSATRNLLLVGPLPPPNSGSHVTFKILCDELTRRFPHHVVQTIDTSQKKLKKTTRIAALGNLKQARFIVREFRKSLRSTDQVMVFGSNGFLLSMAPVLVWLAKRANKPVYLRAFGGSLDQFAEGLNPVLRKLFHWTIRNADGLSVQTALLHDRFKPMLGEQVHLATGYRNAVPEDQRNPPQTVRAHLHVVFVGIVRAEKGVFVLLDSLRKVHREGVNIQCDIFGPIWPACAERFEQELPQTVNANYRGILEPDEVIATMANYDALVLPTHYQGEGHPGVIIEAMMAGIPVVTTSFRSIPELIEDEANGLLIPPHDVDALANALRRIEHDRELLRQMGQRNWEQRRQFEVSRVVPKLLQQMGVNA